MARQYANPAGLFGRVFTAGLLNRANRESNRAVYSSLDVTRGDRVLEVGFGGAELLFEIARRSGCSAAYGVESSEAMLVRARSRIRQDKSLNNTLLSKGEIEALPFADNSFDRVCSVNTIYFWRELTGSIRELARVTGVNGRVVLGFSSGEILLQSGYAEKGFQFYQPNDILQSMAKAGLSVLCNEKINRKNKDPFIVQAYCKDEE